MKRFKVTFRVFVALILTIVIAVLGLQFFQYQSRINYSQKSKEPDYFGASFMTLNNEFYTVVNNEMKSVIESNGDVMITLDAALSVNKQKEQIQYLIRRGCKVIFISPVDMNALDSILNECDKQGVKVIAVDTNVKSDHIAYTVVSDNYNAGVLAAQDMMSQKENASILLLKHSATQSSLDRIQGFLDTIKGNNNYQVVGEIECEGQLEISMPKVDDFIHSGVQFDVVMALNDPSAIGAIAALDSNNINNVLVYGVDGTPDAKKLISENKMRCSIAQSPIQIGRRSIEIAYKLLSDEVVKNEDKIPVTLISEDNIAGFNIEGWQ